MRSGRVSVVVDDVRIQVVFFSGASKSAKESDREAWKHNELSPPLPSGEHVKEIFQQKGLLRT